MDHPPADRCVTGGALERLSAQLRDLRFECVRADGCTMKIPVEFAIGRSGGLAHARKLVEQLLEGAR